MVSESARKKRRVEESDDSADSDPSMDSDSDGGATTKIDNAPTPKDGKGLDVDPLIFKNPEKMSALEFMQAKEVVLKEVNDLLAAGRSNKSIRIRMEKVMKKLSAAEMSRLETSPESALEGLRDADCKLEEIKQKVEPAKTATWTAILATVKERIVGAEQARSSAENVYAALDWMLDKKLKAQKAVTSSKRYKKLRFANRLSRGGTNS